MLSALEFNIVFRLLIKGEVRQDKGFRCWQMGEIKILFQEDFYSESMTFVPYSRIRIQTIHNNDPKNRNSRFI